MRTPLTSRGAWGIPKAKKVGAFDSAQRKYLAHHRNKVFEKATKATPP